jgi:hypothetical protein
MVKKNAGNTLWLAAIAVAGLITPNIGLAQASKIMAQQVVDETKASHPEITGLEIAAIKPGEGCKTIAATEANEVGQSCDKDELTARKTNRPFVEKEKDEYDVTLPIHDSAGKVIATAGMDFKLEAGRNKTTVVRNAQRIAAELEKRFFLRERVVSARAIE